jgi:hypothetical protein
LTLAVGKLNWALAFGLNSQKHEKEKEEDVLNYLRKE